MNKKTAVKLILLCIGSVLLSACSTVVDSHTRKQPMMSAYMNGDHAAVLEEVEYQLRQPAWYNSSVVNTGDELMWRLEAGSLYFHLGRYAESVEQFRIAERLIAGYDDRAVVSVRDVGAEAGALLTNMNALPYRGYCRDRMALSVYKALAYLGTGREDSFRAQLKRLRNEQKKVQNDYRKFFEEEQAAITAAAKKNPASGRTAAIAAKRTSVNAEFDAGLSTVNQVAHKGYGNFLNPAAIFLSGLGSFRDGSYGNAAVDFKRLYESMPWNPVFQRYYVTALQKASRKIPDGLKQVKPFEFPLEKDCVYVIMANGRSGAFRQVSVQSPVMAAWPMCEFYPVPFGSFRITADGRQYDSALLADMDGILAQEYRERLPGMITRIVLNTLLKDGAYYTGITALSVADMDSDVRALALTFTALIGSWFRTAMNTADTRSWEILPKEFLLTQFPMPRQREIVLHLPGNGSPGRTAIRIPDDCRSALLFINAPSAQNVSCHVLPIRSK